MLIISIEDERRKTTKHDLKTIQKVMTLKEVTDLCGHLKRLTFKEKGRITQVHMDTQI